MNSFLAAREDNVANGTMSKGRQDVPQQPKVPAPAVPVAAGMPNRSYPGNLHQYDISYTIGPTKMEKTFFVQASEEQFVNFNNFLIDIGVAFKDRPIQVENIDEIRMGLRFAVPDQPKKQRKVTKKRKLPLLKKPKGETDNVAP
jgi:hypothetical protein